jgi:hypothetical protein
MRRIMNGTGLGCMALVLLACSAAGQTPGRTSAQQPSVQALLAEFVRYEEAAATSIRPLPPNPRLPHVLAAPAQYPPATLVGVLDGLEDLALRSPNGSVRVAAVSWLSGAGEVGSMGATGLADRDVAVRLGRVWERSADAGVREVILGRMWAQANREETVRVLTAAALLNREQDLKNDFPEPYVAVLSLSRMGAEGVGALRQLRARGVVNNPRARGLLEYLEERGYRPQ